MLAGRLTVMCHPCNPDAPSSFALCWIQLAREGCSDVEITWHLRPEALSIDKADKQILHCLPSYCGSVLTTAAFFRLSSACRSRSCSFQSVSSAVPSEIWSVTSPMLSLCLLQVSSRWLYLCSTCSQSSVRSQGNCCISLLRPMRLYAACRAAQYQWRLEDGATICALAHHNGLQTLSHVILKTRREDALHASSARLQVQSGGCRRIYLM